MVQERAERAVLGGGEGDQAREVGGPSGHDVAVGLVALDGGIEGDLRLLHHEAVSVFRSVHVGRGSLLPHQGVVEVVKGGARLALVEGALGVAASQGD